MASSSKKPDEWIVVDDCSFMMDPPKGYSSDPERKPHGVVIVNLRTGTKMLLQNGSRISIVSEYIHHAGVQE